jgi:hypothetical protein
VTDAIWTLITDLENVERYGDDDQHDMDEYLSDEFSDWFNQTHSGITKWCPPVSATKVGGTGRFLGVRWFFVY